MRKLASVQRIAAVEPIPDADAIEKVRVLGWSVVVKKGDFRPGDAVVYCEIDSLLPERPEFEFLRKNCWRPPVLQPDTGQVIVPGGFRIKTVRLRGQFSQGICFPLDLLPAGASREEGADVTDALAIAKYEPPVPTDMNGRVRGPFPGFLPKTDETRVQVLVGVLERHKGKTFYVTEKEDGTSFTAFVRGDDYGVCGRTQRFDETDEGNSLCRLAKRLALEEKLRAARARLGKDLALQGEVIGPGVQKNKYALREHRLRLFNVLDLGTYRLLDHAEMLRCVADLGLETVPQLGTLVLNHTVDQLVELSMGTSVLNPRIQREGIVLRTPTEEQDPDIGRLSFKAINPKFLVKYEE
ncbi:MAG: RNA ligase (ATP) [Planctomycetes bacterium]|nr:RNA ligase (ATP) [Planctomycetota bacterium]